VLCYRVMGLLPVLCCRVVRSLAEDFQAESEVCLIVLHLEVRVHCFFHLIPLAKQVIVFIFVVCQIIALRTHKASCG